MSIIQQDWLASVAARATLEIGPATRYLSPW